MTIELSIIIPIYNEEDNIYPLYEKILESMKRLGKEFEVLLVNDGSKDKSPKRLNDLAEKDSRFKVIHFRKNCGQTAALMAGIKHSQGEVIVPMDGDLQNDPNDIPRLLEKLDEGYDVCSGWRKERKDHLLRRNLPSRIANKLISQISGVYLHDYGCSLKAYRREVIEDVKLYGEMHRFFPIYASMMGARVAEIPVSHNPRTMGESKYGMERIIKVLLDLVVVQFLSTYLQKPIYFFGFWGILNFLVSFVTVLIILYYKFFGGKSFIATPLPIVFAVTFLAGLSCILMGVLGEMIIRIYYESQDKTVYIIDSTRNLG